MSYVRSFENFSHAIEEPILELRELVEFIASILKDGDEISLPGSMPATSPHFNTILNPEPATQTSASGHVKTDDQYGSSAFEDSRQAAGYSSAMNKSPSPSYSPPPSPSPSVNTLLKPFSVPWITAEEPSLDRPSPMLLQPSALYQTKRSPAPPRTPHWKIDLNDRKGHPINKLHVGPQELDILARCLKLVHSATRKGEECMRVIIENQALATEMQAEYEQWDEFCMDVEDNVSIDAREARHETEQDFGYTKVDDDAKGKGKAKDPTIYGRATAHGSTDNFDSAGDYGRIGPRAPQTAWGYRKFDAPASKGQTHFPRLTSLPEDPDETEDEADECDVRPGKKRRLGTDSQASTERGLGSPMSLSDSDRTDGVEEVMNFEEAFEEEEEGPDQEMEDVGLGAAGAGGIVDVGDGDEDDGDGEGGKGKKGLVGGGGKVLGLYGEEL